MAHISDIVKEEILSKATLHNVLSDYHGFHKKTGSNYVMECPKCGTVDKLSYSESKSVAKCFKCDIGVKTPVNYLMKYQGMTYGQSLEELARIESIEIPKKKANKVRQALHQVPYVQTMLEASGLNTGDITDSVIVNENTRKEIPLYKQGSVDNAFEIINGDDVIIFYYDLEGRPMQYYKKDKKGNPVGKKRDFYRVRFQNPDLHLDRYGNPCKYKSPYGSDTKIYINKFIREKYKKSSKIKTLYIQEGEKKADKATKHGLNSVGIMGIHNIAQNKRLPTEFELIIKRCQVEQVVFVLDGDCFDLSTKINSNAPADNRPKSFYRAVVNFRDHFYAFSNIDIHLKIFFAYIKPNIEKDKGLDDLLTNSMRNKEDELKGLCEKALIDPKGDAKWLQFHNITTVSEFKIKEYWHLQNKDAFANHYKPILKDLPKFKFGSVEWRFNEKGVLELAQPLMSHEQFWKEDVKRDNDGKEIHKKYSFNHKRCYTFLQNRGFYRLKQPGNTFIWINIDGSIVKRVEPYQIKDYVVDFTSQLNKEDVENMLYRGGRMYLGPDSLGNIIYTELQLNAPSKNIQYLYFKDVFFKVTDEHIELHRTKELAGQVWKDSIKDFTPTQIAPMVHSIHRINDKDIIDDPSLEPYKNEWTLDFSEQGMKCDFLQFLLNTSIFFGKEKTFQEATLQERFDTSRHLLSKLTAFGYMLHRYRNSNNERAVIGMDGVMSEVGNSNGRSGKSLFGVALEQLVPTVTIPGKKKDLLDDRFLFEEVDQRTCCIFFDDVRVNFDFEFLFPYITGKFTLEKKGMGKVTLPREYVQKFYIATNHALNGEGGSFRDRQFLLGFSNWYNSDHKPVDDFKVMFFDEWDETQWNLFYNFAALCLHLYLKHGLIQAPNKMLFHRKLRQEIGETFIDWADEYFSNVKNVNDRIYKDTMYQCVRGDGVDWQDHGDGFITKYPGERKYTNIRRFKDKLKKYCKLKGYDYNPSKSGEDIKTSGREYIEVVVPEVRWKELNDELLNSVPQDDIPV